MQIRSKKLPKVVADTIEDQCYKIPWLFQKDGTYANHEGRKKFPCFTMLLCQEPNERTQHYDFFPWQYIDGASLMSSRKKKRAHVALQLPNPKKFNSPHNIHVDYVTPHDVLLYYINDADGDTFFFDDQENVIHRETPQKGKMIIFDGSIPHASSSPSEDFRFILNICYERT